MRVLLTLCFLATVISAFAGTFKDDFNDNKLDGWISLIQGGEINVKYGEVIIIDSDFSRTTGITFNNGQLVGDFTLNVDGKMVRRIDNSLDYMCIWARFVEEKGFAWASYHPANDMRLNLYDGNINCVDMNIFPIAFELGRWYRLEIKINGGKISFSIDGKSTKEKDWSGRQQLADKGQIGIGAGGAEVHFDNFVITGDEIQGNTKSILSVGKLTTTWGEIKSKN